MAAYGTIKNTQAIGAGTLIITGARAPVAGDGADGDYWLDSAAKILYGPKAGTWPVAIKSA